MADKIKVNAQSINTKVDEIKKSMENVEKSLTDLQKSYPGLGEMVSQDFISDFNDSLGKVIEESNTKILKTLNESLDALEKMGAAFLEADQHSSKNIKEKR